MRNLFGSIRILVVRMLHIFLQVRSAFGMAYATLTNPKAILSLGPKRSILGTIIRPDPVLLERKGGSNGAVTFSSLLPGAGEPLQTSLYEEQQDILYNWQLDDEEPLPRGGGNAGDVSAHSSERKRKSSSKERHRKKKVKENGDDVRKVLHEEETVSKKAKSSRKKRSRHNHKHYDANGFDRPDGASSWSR